MVMVLWVTGVHKLKPNTDNLQQNFRDTWPVAVGIKKNI